MLRCACVSCIYKVLCISEIWPNLRNAIARSRQGESLFWINSQVYEFNNECLYIMYAFDNEIKL